VPESQRQKKGGIMKKEYDLKTLKKRSGKVKVDPEAAKVPTSLMLDGSDLAAIWTEALRLGIPYQTLIGSLIHRYVSGELVDRRTVILAKEIKDAS
jgi:predicted DNA binding CopG/RHH family protein